MKSAVIIMSVLSFASGITLLWLALDWVQQEFLVFLGVGILCILAAIGYTIGKKPYGYAGLGDASVLIFFGLVGVMGSYYLMAKTIEWSLVLPSLSCGLFSVAVLNINNIRDIESDLAAGKYSVPVRIGREKAIVYNTILLVTAVVTSLVYVVINFRSGWQLLFLLIFPILVKINSAVKNEASTELDPWLKRMALTTLLFVILFGVGLIL
jgi:1,4-dihydroxy-2-naphthoate octaprenyltransferase